MFLLETKGHKIIKANDRLVYSQVSETVVTRKKRRTIERWDRVDAS